MKRDPNPPDEFDVALGRTIRARRRSLRLSQEKLAAQCGVTLQQVFKYERGDNRVSISRLFKIAKALGCRPGDLIELADVMVAFSPDEPVIDVLLQLPETPELLLMFTNLSPVAREKLVQLLTEVASSQTT